MGGARTAHRVPTSADTLCARKGMRHFASYAHSVAHSLTHVVLVVSTPGFLVLCFCTFLGAFLGQLLPLLQRSDLPRGS